MKEITQTDAKKTSNMTERIDKTVQRRTETVQRKDRSGLECLIDLPDYPIV